MEAKYFLFVLIYFLLLLNSQKNFIIKAELLGIHQHTDQNVAKVLEILTSYERIFNLCRFNKLWWMKRKNIEDMANNIDTRREEISETDSIILLNSIKIPAYIEVPKTQIKELQCFDLQAEWGLNLAELTTILVSKYLSLTYSVKFVHGYNYFKKQETEKRMACIRIANYLAYFGVSSTMHIAEAIELILLEERRPELQHKFSKMKENLSDLVDLVYKNVNQKFYEKQPVSEEMFQTKNFHDLIKDLNLYYQNVVFEVPNTLDQVIVDTQGDVLIWNEATTLLEGIIKIPQKTNTDSWENDFQISGVATVLRTLVQIPAPEELQSYTLIMRPTEDDMLKLATID